MVRTGCPAIVMRATTHREEATVTDERTVPGTGPDELEPGDERQGTDREDSPPSPQHEDKETNPLLREGPDAPDAADIEDPDEQL